MRWCLSTPPELYVMCTVFGMHMGDLCPVRLPLLPPPQPSVRHRSEHVRAWPAGNDTRASGRLLCPVTLRWMRSRKPASPINVRQSQAAVRTASAMTTLR
mmetsp:Transcript_23528/g.61592  ORF Transcript_23528/g.61592 Transcript_23528/m.61592 type:complete len:100 (+) Transcript_23528:631-930(+)